MRIPLIFFFSLLSAATGGAAVPGLPPTVANGAKLQVVHQSLTENFEGPVWVSQSARLFFTAFGADRTATRVLCLGTEGKVAVWMDNTEGINGLAWSSDGRLLCAQSYGHRVLSLGVGDEGPADARVLLADPTMNQPNDLCVAADGSIYFTDPDFVSHRKGALYRLESSGKLTRVAQGLSTPNGLALSKDGTRLVVSDSETRRWLVFPVLEDGLLGEARVFFDPPMADKNEPGTKPDGVCVDELGNFYLTGHHGIWVLATDARVLGFIAIPEFPSNLCFGGSDGRTLFITAHHHVYSLSMRVAGLLP